MNLDSSTESRITLRDRFRAATKEAILDAAAELLTSDGAAHIRMEDIAAKAGIAVGTLYNYFEDRTELVTALLETRTRTLFQALDAITSGGSERAAAEGVTEASPAARFADELARFLAAVFHHVNTNRYLFSLLIENERHNGLDAQVLARRKAVRGEMFVRAEALMAQGIRMQALRTGDAGLYATLVIGMVQGIVARALAQGNALPGDGSKEIVRLFMNGAAARAEAGVMP